MAFDAFALILAMLALGMLFARLRVMPANAAEVLNLVVLYVCLPAAVLVHVPKLAFDATLLGVAATPWLLAGAKTLSYAVNMAALRHAARQGADDVIFVSSEGYVLEGPRSTVVIATDSAGSGPPRLLTPPLSYPILRGTTQQVLFETAAAKSYDCAYEVLLPADLFAAQGVWLVSSMTLAARVHTLDGSLLRPNALATEFSELVDSAVLSDR